MDSRDAILRYQGMTMTALPHVLALMYTQRAIVVNPADRIPPTRTYPQGGGGFHGGEGGEDTSVMP